MSIKVGRPAYPKVRMSVMVSGILMTALHRRWEEFFYPGFSPYALELICFDLRTRRTHSITAPISRSSLQARESVDREIVRHYQPGSPERNGALIKFMLGAAMEPAQPAQRGSFNPQMQRVRVPERIAGCLAERIGELGYDGFSAYVNGLIRFDLGLGGPHKYFDGRSMEESYLRELDDITVGAFRSKIMRPAFIDRFLEDLRGRPMTPEERDAELGTIAAELLRSSARMR